MGVRTEDERDRAAVRAVNVAAFGTALEADLVDTLRATVKPTISLVAEIEGVVVGHIMFSPVSLAEHPQLNIMGLAPMAVAPDRQRQGIGSALVRTGITKMRGTRLRCHRGPGAPGILSTLRIHAGDQVCNPLRVRRAGGSLHDPGAQARRPAGRVRPGSLPQSIRNGMSDLRTSPSR